MREHGLEPQVVMTLPLLEGTDGVEKMSKSLNNYIGVTEPAREIYGKIMSISDQLMFRYFELVTDMQLEEIRLIKSEMEAGKRHPKKVKSGLAKMIIRDFYNEEAASDAEAHFEQIFAKKGLPDEMPEIILGSEDILLAKLMSDNGLAKSGGEARRLISQGAVTIDGEKVSDPTFQLVLDKPEAILKVGKRRFARLKTQ